MKRFFLLLMLLLTGCAPASPATRIAVASPSPFPATDTPLAFSPTPFTVPHQRIPTATYPAPPPTPSMPVYTTRVSAADGMPQVFVPAGSLHMGGVDVFADSDELPYHDVKMKAFWVDQLEVTNGMYALCVGAGACLQPRKAASLRRPGYFGGPEFQDYPVVQVTWSDAQAYCTWAGRRLPTEAEWERAARGDDLRTYPWGDEPPSAHYVNYANLVRETTRVGSYPAGASPFGALDMAGNVWEWVSDYYDSDYYRSAPTADPRGPTENYGRYQRVIRGGSFQDEWVTIRLSNRGYEMGPDPSAPYGSLEQAGNTSARIGFRCVSDQ